MTHYLLSTLIMLTMLGSTVSIDYSDLERFTLCSDTLGLSADEIGSNYRRHDDVDKHAFTFFKDSLVTILPDQDSLRAPNFTFKDSTGQSFQLEDYRGQVVYLSFWASWCGACKKSFKNHNAIRKTLSDVGVVFINVSIDQDPHKWISSLRQHNYINHVNVRAEDLNQVNMQYGLSKIPSFHIIDKQGQFVFMSDDANRDVVGEFRQWVEN